MCCPFLGFFGTSPRYKEGPRILTYCPSSQRYKTPLSTHNSRLFNLKVSTLDFCQSIGGSRFYCHDPRLRHSNLFLRRFPRIKIEDASYTKAQCGLPLVPALVLSIVPSTQTIDRFLHARQQPIRILANQNVASLLSQSGRRNVRHA